ncbi:hypothetical protein J542_2133 [Acinetobacter baumannii 299505]|uniref:ATP-binding protein n=1 Tax=Acinetobacter baumannii TaxID=470 RepID=UPI00044CFC25|nr:ATP-binding protein [Acinetobacter baumannii]EXB83209.1 hypothetical protein J542_2133 [Acinetobacter baumannii 299505]MCW1490952.1 ATP-binding protein [Acinetobacter baumannii]
MSLQTNLKGRLRNTALPKTHGLMPVFEAVVNSIQSIEEKGEGDTGKIILQIDRDTQTFLDLKSKELPPIIGFTVIDNGCGFNDENLKSFKILDSEHKIEKGCRGVGRLMWLKVFDRVEIESHFVDIESCLRKRTFNFNDTLAVHKEQLVNSDAKESGTTIKLIGFEKSYRDRLPTTGLSIANQLLEHVLWYFVRQGGAPKIIVNDGSDCFDLDNLLQKHMHSSAFHETINIFNHSFDLTHIKFRSSVNKKHQIALCAANRLVEEYSIQGKIPGLYAKISDETGDFIYTCYVSSEYLNDRVRSERTSFDIAEDVSDLFEDITLRSIREEVLKRAKQYLNDVLSKNIAAGRKRIEDFISNHAPRYRPIVGYVNDELLIVDPDKSDKELELHLHAQWYEVERQLVEEGHDIMQPRKEDHVEEYKKRVSNYLKKAEDLKQSDLANYVTHRRVIIDLLQKTIGLLDDGKYAREEMIHELIMPMQKDSSEVFLESCNLWLIDERLAFHNYLASDKTINAMPISESASGKEPDLLSLKIFDNPILVNDQTNFPLASITVVEMKRPMRNDMKEGEDKDPIEQALGYVERIREGQVKTKDGYLIPRNDHIPAYCYVVCDLTPSMIKRCKNFSLTMTADGMGFFGYNPNYKSYIEVISFNQLVRSAKERNKAFFDKLGLSSN